MTPDLVRRPLVAEREGLAASGGRVGVALRENAAWLRAPDFPDRPWAWLDQKRNNPRYKIRS